MRRQRTHTIPKRNLQPLIDIMTPTYSGNEIISCPTYSGVQWILHKASREIGNSPNNVEIAKIPKNRPVREIKDHSNKSPSPHEILSRNEQATSQGDETAESCDSNNSEVRNFVQSAALQTIENVNRRSDFVLIGVARGIDFNRIFANTATDTLQSLPPDLASECEAFILHFLKEVLKQNYRNAV